jgi:hypothetical protein
MKKLLTGEIKAFAVRDGVLYHVRKNKFGSDIYVKNAKYFHFDSLLVQDMAFRDNGDLIFIGFREADGNNLYVLTADRVLKQLTDQDFSFSGLSVAGGDVYFSANYGNAWQPYRMDLDAGEIYLLAGDGLAAYPVEFKDKLYYITIGDGKEVLKEVAGEEQTAVWSGARDRISMPALVSFTGKSVWENAWSLVWPDLSLPYYIPGMDDQPGFAGLVIIGHDALGVHQYNFNLLYDSTFHYDGVWNYRAFPPLSATIRINDQPDLTAGLFDLLCWLRNAGLLRSISLSSAFYPYSKDIDGLISLRLKPGETARLDMYAAGIFPMGSDNGLVGRAGLSFYWPFRFGVLVSRFQAGYAAESLSVVLPSGAEVIGVYGAKAGLRFTLPVAAPRWGIDFPHLFIERIWASLEAQAGTASDQLATGLEPVRYNYLGYLTLNMSVLNGFLKIRPSMGAVLDPAADKKFTPYFSVTTDLLALLDRMENRRRMTRTIDRFPEDGSQ